MATVLDAAGPRAETGSASHSGFALAEEQLAVKKMVREFAESEIAPHVMEWDEAQIYPSEISRSWASWVSSASSCPRATGARASRTSTTSK